MARLSKKKRINVTVGYQDRFASGFSRTKNTLDSRHINRERFRGESKTRLWLQGFIEHVTNFDLVKTYNLILLFWFIASVVATPAFRLLLYALILNHALMTIVEVIFGSAVLFVVGIQGIAVTAIARILRQTQSSTVLFID